MRWKTRHVRHAAEMAHEVEAAAAKAAFVQFAKAALGNAIVDIGDGAKGPVAHGDGVQRHPVVGAVHAGIDDDGTADPELPVQRPEILQRRVGRRIGPSRRVGIFVTGAEDVGMRVARQRRELECRRSRIGIGSGNRRLVHGAFCSVLVALHGVSRFRKSNFLSAFQQRPLRAAGWTSPGVRRCRDDLHRTPETRRPSTRRVARSLPPCRRRRLRRATAA